MKDLSCLAFCWRGCRKPRDITNCPPPTFDSGTSWTRTRNANHQIVCVCVCVCVCVIHFRHIHKMSETISVIMCVRMEQHSICWTGLNRICCKRIFRKSVEKIRDSLKPDKNNGYYP
jgi:hypothetical protein